MKLSSPLIDIHCHLLPDFDDGAASWGETLLMAQIAEADGIAQILVTPRQLGSYSHNQADSIRQATCQLRAQLHERGLRLDIQPGAEVWLQADLPQRLADDQVLTLADRRKHLLVELPHVDDAVTDAVLDGILSQGITPILAHPERHPWIMQDPEQLERRVERGCLVQATAGSLMGLFGAESQQFVEWLLREDLVHFVASAAHGSRARRPLLQRAMVRTTELIGGDRAQRLFCRHPALVAEGADVQPYRVRRKTLAFPQWFWRRKAA